MNFQEKLFETSAELRSRAQAIATTALRALAGRCRRQASGSKLKGSLAILNTAGRELNKVARRHAIRFVQQNSTHRLAGAQRRVGAGPLDLSRR